MEISNNQSYYINPNTRQFTSNVKNTAIKDREVFNGSMQNLLNPIEDLVQVLKTPIKLVDSSSLNRLSNSVNIASDMRIAVNDGYILKVKQQGVEVSGGNDPYDTEAYMKAQKMAGSLSVAECLWEYAHSSIFSGGVCQMDRRCIRCDGVSRHRLQLLQMNE